MVSFGFGLSGAGSGFFEGLDQSDQRSLRRLQKQEMQGQLEGEKAFGQAGLGGSLGGFGGFGGLENILGFGGGMPQQQPQRPMAPPPGQPSAPPPQQAQMPPPQSPITSQPLPPPQQRQDIANPNTQWITPQAYAPQGGAGGGFAPQPNKPIDFDKSIDQQPDWQRYVKDQLRQKSGLPPAQSAAAGISDPNAPLRPRVVPTQAVTRPMGPVGAGAGPAPVPAGPGPQVAQQPTGGGGGGGGGGMQMPQMGGGDLQNIASRIKQANPNITPLGMYYALSAANKLLNPEGRMQLQMYGMILRSQMEQQNLDERRRYHDYQMGQGQQGQQGALSENAIEEAAENYRQTGKLPPGMWSRSSAPLRNLIINRAAELDTQQGRSAKDIPAEQQQKRAAQIAIQRFESGPQGNTIRSLGVVVDHLETMRELAAAAQNGNYKLFNQIAQNWAEATGSAVPTNIDTAGKIIGPEIIKALGVTGAGTAEERQGLAAAFNRASSPQQILGAIDTVAQPMLTGQLQGLLRQFRVSTRLKDDDFYQMIGPNAEKYLQRKQQRSGGDAGGGGGQSVPMGGGWSVQTQ